MVRVHEKHRGTAALEQARRAKTYRTLTDVDMLVEARSFVRAGWSQGANARDKYGIPVSPINGHAVEFCIRGACIRVLRPSLSELSTEFCVPSSYISTKIASALGFDNSKELVAYNDADGRTQEHVIEHLTARIRALRRGIGKP